MTNNQIIRNEAARLDPATLHAIATAHHTPDEIAAIAAACKTTDENGNEQPATVADVEIMLAADELHTFDHWKKEGKSVKKGEKHLVCCYLWKYTTKPSKEQREKAAAEGKEAARQSRQKEKGRGGGALCVGRPGLFCCCCRPGAGLFLPFAGGVRFFT